MKTKALAVAGLAFTVGLLAAHSGIAAIHYVDKDNAGAAEPYGSQATAAPDIQTAINYSSVGATIMVYAATYDVGWTNV